MTFKLYSGKIIPEVIKMVKNKLAAFIYRGFLLLASFIAMVYIVIDMTQTRFTLVYYTNLSNVAVFIFFAVFAAFEIINLIKKTDLGHNKYFYTAKGAITMCIVITGLIYHFLLAEPQNPGFWEAGNLIKHYIVPAMVFIDWLVFDSRRRYKWWSPLTNVILPYAYLIFALIRGAIVGPESELQYCYGFINVTEYGALRVFINCLVITLAVLALSYLIYLVDQLPALIKRKSKKVIEQKPAGIEKSPDNETGDETVSV